MKQKSNKEFCEYVLDQLSEIDGLKAKAMFGGFGIYSEGIIFALIIGDGTLYFKVNDFNRPDFLEIGSKPFEYKNKNGKDVVMPYFEIPPHLLEDKEQILLWAKKSIKSVFIKTSSHIM
jgi:DNA transformation protein